MHSLSPASLLSLALLSLTLTHSLTLIHREMARLACLMGMFPDDAPGTVR